MITEDQYVACAALLKCDVPAVKAVDKVESNGSGFLNDGQPVILFEPHIFWKELKKIGIDPTEYVTGNEDILYPTWGEKPYGKSSQQHERLKRAVSINKDAALKSASWGRFQILGKNYRLAGYPTIQEFINDMYESEAKHLSAFSNYILNTGLDDELRAHNWIGFAIGYNGSSYWKNNYDKKLSKAYNFFTAS